MTSPIVGLFESKFENFQSASLLAICLISFAVFLLCLKSQT
jgi:hypothetical protein